MDNVVWRSTDEGYTWTSVSKEKIYGLIQNPHFNNYVGRLYNILLCYFLLIGITDIFFFRHISLRSKTDICIRPILELLSKNLKFQ